MTETGGPPAFNDKSEMTSRILTFALPRKVRQRDATPTSATSSLDWRRRPSEKQTLKPPRHFADRTPADDRQRLRVLANWPSGLSRPDGIRRQCPPPRIRSGLPGAEQGA